MILPNKKVLSVFVLTSSLVIAAIITFGRDKSSQAINAASNLLVGEKINLPENPGWQKELGIISENPTSTTTSSNTQTDTDNVSTTLISNYLTLSQSGNLNQNNIDNLANQTANLVGGVGTKPITEKDLVVVPDSGLNGIITYGENLGNIFKANRPTQIKNELQIIMESVNERNASKIKDLDPIILTYQKISTEMVKMNVPKTFVKAHLDMVNGVLYIITSLNEMAKVFNDPIRSLGAIKTYQEGGLLFGNAKKATGEFILKNKVIYKQGSGGYYLIYGI